MKKRFLLMIMMMAMVALLTACGTFVCDACKEEKSGEPTVVNLGQELSICEDCMNTLGL